MNNLVNKSNEPWKKFISTLLDSTTDGSQKWDPIEPQRRLYSPKEYVVFMYETSFQEKKVLLFKKNWEEIPKSSIFSTKSEDKVEKKSKFVLMLTDENYFSGFEVPIQDNLDILYEAVKFQVSGANEIFKQFAV